MCCLQVELQERRVWASDRNTTRAAAPLQAQNTGSMRVYRNSGCGEVACRNSGWTVQHSAVVLVADLDGGLARLHSDAAAVRSYIRTMHGGDLMPGEYAVNVQVSWLGTNPQYQMETQVLPSSRRVGRSAESSTPACTSKQKTCIATLYIMPDLSGRWAHDRTAQVQIKRKQQADWQDFFTGIGILGTRKIPVLDLSPEEYSGGFVRLMVPWHVGCCKPDAVR